MKTLTRKVAEALEDAFDSDARDAYRFNVLEVVGHTITFEPGGFSFAIDPETRGRGKEKYKEFSITVDSTYPSEDVVEALNRVFSHTSQQIELGEKQTLALHREEFETGIVRTLQSKKW